MRRWLLYLSIGFALCALGALGVPVADSAPAPPPVTTTTPSATPPPASEPELAILQYVVDHNPDWLCQGPSGSPGHRQITNCYPFTVFTHPTSGYVDGYPSPAAAQAAWATRRATAQATYPVFADEDYAGYPGYHAGDTAFPYAHYENYLWGVTWVLGAVSSDDTNFRGSPVIAAAIFDAAQALGYLPPNPTPTVTATPGSPVPSLTATLTPSTTPVCGDCVGDTGTPSPTRTITPTHSPGPPECETFYNSSTTSCEPPGTYHYQFSYYALGCPVTRHVTVYFEVAPDGGGPWTNYDQTSFDFTFWTNDFEGDFYEPDIPAPYAWYRIFVSNVPGASWPPTTPQQICGSGGTVTVTPGTPLTTTPTTTPTIGPPCDVFNYGTNLTTCDLGGHFTYDFPFVTYGSCPQYVTVTVRFEIAPDSSGPWTLYDQQSYGLSWPQGSTHIQGQFVESFIPATDPWYRIVLWGLPGPAYGGIAGPARNCLVLTPMPTYPPTGTPTATPSPSPTIACAAGFVPVGETCAPQYIDVPPTNPFYPYVECLAGRGILSGYADGTFHPYANVTRGQAAKILSNAAGYTEPISATQQTFADVPPSHPFWEPVERVALHSVFSGYGCGGPGEPCHPQNRAYFRPAANLTRSQLAKIDAAANGYTDLISPTQQTFADVPATNPFWLPVERVALHGVISGYTCGGPGEPCDAGNRPYFRPYGAVTRGQTAKIVSLTFFPGCSPMEAAASAPGCLPPPPTAPIVTATPAPGGEPELAILQYMVDHNPLLSCGAIGGTPGHRAVSCVVGAGHAATGYVDNYGDPASAQTAWAARRDNAQNTYPIFGDDTYGGYPGYHAGNDNFPYAHYENYLWGDIWVLGAAGSDDTALIRSSEAIANAIYHAALDLGYLAANPTPTPTEVPCAPTYTPTPGPSETITRTPVQGTIPPTPVATNTPVSTPTATQTGSPTPPSFCEVFTTGGTASCTAPDTYHYSFGFWTYSCSMSGYVGVYFEVAADPGGPWTLYDQVNMPYYWPPGGSGIAGDFYEPGIPAQYLYYSIGVTAPGPPSQGTTPQPLCGANPTVTITPPTPLQTTTTIATATTTACPIAFSDVPPANPFYVYVECLACRGVISGYADGTFRPYANVTRGQAAKILAEVVRYSDPISGTQQTFADVPPSQPFWLPIERAAMHGLFSGYACGGAGEPCDGQQRPYFRPAANLTRGQLAKIDAAAKGYTDPITPTQQTFTDVPGANPFWLPVERVAMHGVISGYGCGGPGEPCDAAHRPYFRPAAAVTRSETAKIVANTFQPGCVTPRR